MMIPKLLEYYDWFTQIQPKLCELMGIEEEYFHNYHKLVGGEYKDFWHVYLELFDINGNDTYYSQMWDGHESLELIKAEKSFSGENEWKMLLVNAIDELHNELGEDEITIWISW